ncbi:hypothetical protein [Paenibacillus polymyxa]|nr:hypothetical protein [Paenibacillus polymyxa]
MGVVHALVRMEDGFGMTLVIPSLQQALVSSFPQSAVLNYSTSHAPESA